MDNESAKDRRTTLDKPGTKSEIQTIRAKTAELSRTKRTASQRSVDEQLKHSTEIAYTAESESHHLHNPTPNAQCSTPPPPPPPSPTHADEVCRERRTLPPRPATSGGLADRYPPTPPPSSPLATAAPGSRPTIRRRRGGGGHAGVEKRGDGLERSGAEWTKRNSFVVFNTTRSLP